MISYTGDSGLILDSYNRVLLFILSFQLSTKQLDLCDISQGDTHAISVLSTDLYVSLDRSDRRLEKNIVLMIAYRQILEIYACKLTAYLCLVRFLKFLQLTHRENSKYITSLYGTWLHKKRN